MCALSAGNAGEAWWKPWRCWGKVCKPRTTRQRLRHHVMSMRREVELLVPWAALIDRPPELLTEPDAEAHVLQAWHGLIEALPVTPRLREIPQVSRAAEARLEALPNPPAGADFPPP